MKKKVLIIKWGAIGDVVMTMPLAKALKQDNYEVSWLLGNQVKELIENTNLVKKIISFKENDLFNRGLFIKLITLLKIWKKIGFRKYDTIYVLHQDIRYRVIPFFSLGKKRILQAGKNFFPEQYHAKQYLTLLKNGPVEYPQVNIALQDKFLSLFDNRKTVVLVPGGANNPLRKDTLKRWPIEHYVSLSLKLIELGVNVIVIGGRTDDWVTKYFSKIPVKNLIGKTTLLDLLGIYRKSDLLITHDTGPMHLAKLTSIEVIALFGPTSPKSFAGKSKKLRVLWGGENLLCRPCYNGKNFSKCFNNKCMKGIGVEDVLQIFNITL